MKERFDRTFQFALVLVLFFPVTIQTLFNNPNTVSIGNKMILEWGWLIATYLIVYLSIEFAGKYNKKIDLMIGMGALYAQIFLFAVMFCFLAKYKDGVLPPNAILPFKVTTFGIYLLPLVLLTVIMIPPAWRYFVRGVRD